MSIFNSKTYLLPSLYTYKSEFDQPPLLYTDSDYDNNNNSNNNNYSQFCYNINNPNNNNSHYFPYQYENQFKENYQCKPINCMPFKLRSIETTTTKMKNTITYI